MKRTLFALSLVGLFALPAVAGSFTVTSPDIAQDKTLKNDQVFNSFGCTGANVSPALSWSGAPAGTKSYAVTVYDPDAPTGSGWWHWVVFNIPVSVTSLAAGAGVPGQEPKGAVQSVTDYGTPGFGGACPPVGDKPHHYIFTVFALKTDKIDLPATAPAAMVGYYLNGNVLGKAVLTGRYGR